MKPILLYTGDSRYRLFDTFTKGFVEGFSQSGIQVFEADLSGDWQNTLNQALGSGLQCVFSFNGIRAALNVGDKSWHDVSGVPLVVMLLDHPLYHLDVIREPIENMVILTIDRRHADFVKKDLGDTRACGFFPHGGMLAEGPEVPRDIDVMFAGSLENPPSLSLQINELPDKDRKLAQGIVEIMEFSHQYSIEEAGRQVAQAQGDTIEPSWFFDKMLPLTLADRYVRHSKRFRLLKTLGQEGLVSCWGFGDGWDQLKDELPDLNFHGEVSTREVLQLMKRSKIALNVLPGFMEGSHERVLSSLRNGALTVTDRSAWLMEEFVEDEEIIFFDWDKLEELPERLKSLLASNEKDLIVKRGKTKADNQHSWQKRSTQLRQGVDF